MESIKIYISNNAHFARCMRFLSHFMRTWYKNKVTKINTPNGLGYALAWKGGIPKVMVQVTKMDRKFVGDIFNKLNPVVIKLRKYFGRVNMIHFVESTDVFTSSNNGYDEHSGTILEQVENLKFKIGIQSYSDIDQMSTFEVDVGQKKVTPDQYVENEVHFCLHGERRKETSTNDQNKDNNDTHVQNVNDDIEDEDEDEIVTSNDMNYNANRNKRGTETTKDDFTILNPKEIEMNDYPLTDDDVMFVHTKKQ